MFGKLSEFLFLGAVIATIVVGVITADTHTSVVNTTKEVIAAPLQQYCEPYIFLDYDTYKFSYGYTVHLSATDLYRKHNKGYLEFVFYIEWSENKTTHIETFETGIGNFNNLKFVYFYDPTSEPFPDGFESKVADITRDIVFIVRKINANEAKIYIGYNDGEPLLVKKIVRGDIINRIILYAFNVEYELDNAPSGLQAHGEVVSLFTAPNHGWQPAKNIIKVGKSVNESNYELVWYYGSSKWLEFDLIKSGI